MIDAVDVIRFVGTAGLRRARDVVRAGLVDDAAWHDADGTVTASVSGSADEPYAVRIETTPRGASSSARSGARAPARSAATASTSPPRS